MTVDIVFGGALRAIGAFYALGGLLVWRNARTEAVADQVLAAIEGKPQQPASVWRTRWLAGSALSLMFCGLSLALLLEWAAPLFVLNWTGQALYLGVLAPRIFDPVDAPSPSGRRATINAFLLFCLTTALVLVASTTGVLRPWRTLLGADGM